MNTKKIFGVLFLVIALVVTQLPVPNVNAENPASEFQMQGTTLIKYLGTSASVTIPDGVEKIGAEAFADCNFIESFSIPNSVVEIEDMAFSGCSSISVLTLPDTMQTLGTFAFYNCENLETMYFGDSLETLGDGIFLGCTSLEKIILSDLNINFMQENGVLYSADQSKLWFLCPGSQETKYSMPSTVKEISKYAFWGCDNIKEVYFSISMEEIPAYAFMNCTSLSKISLPYNIAAIDMKAFAYCTGLTEVTIPISVKYIHPTAFDSCENIKLTENSGEYAIAFFEENIDRFNPVSFYEIEESPLEIPSGETSEVVDSTVDDVEVLGSTHIVGGNAMVIVKSSDNTVVTGYNSLVEQLYGRDWANVFITDNKVNSAAFYGEEELTGISLPENIVKIEDFAFARSAILQINIPESISEIGYASFYHCDNLNEINIPNSVKRIGAYAFDKTPWMEQFYNQNESDFLIVGDGVLIAYKGMSSSLVLPEEVKTISAYTFLNHTEISNISGGTNLEYVDKNAFYGCNISITQKTEEMEVNHSINSTYGVVVIEQVLVNSKYLFMKWIVVFCLLFVGIVFLSFKDRKKKKL